VIIWGVGLSHEILEVAGAEAVATAEGNRALAAVGHSEQREDRLWIAEYLERKADQPERAAKDHTEDDAGGFQTRRKI
jgi:hypothetical protein